MKKFFLFFFLLGLFYSINSQLFKEPYYFIDPDEMHVYKQSHDTLYTSTTFSLQSFDEIDINKYKGHYKIWDIAEKQPDYLVIKLESLDSIPLTTDPYPIDRFSISIYKKKNINEYSIIRDISHLTKEAMINYKTDTIQLENNFEMSLYKLSYMKESLKLKKVKTKADADKINNELNNPKYLTIIENYKEHNKLPDPYAAILKATLINKACLNLGYTPIGASFAMGILNSDKKIKEKGNIIEGFYKDLIK